MRQDISQPIFLHTTSCLVHLLAEFTVTNCSYQNKTKIVITISFSFPLLLRMQLLLLSALTISQFLWSSYAATCADFTVIPEHDYAFYWTGQTRGINAAIDYCNNSVLSGTTLPYLTDYAMIQFVNAFVINLTGGYQEYWAPLRQVDNSVIPSSGWYWLNGTSSADMSIPWGSGQPTDNDYVENNERNCALLRPGSTLDGWTDMECIWTLYVVCGLKREFLMV
jgi:hypothetical protein